MSDAAANRSDPTRLGRDVLIRILGVYSCSPMDSLALACVSTSVASFMNDDVWNALREQWTVRWSRYASASETSSEALVRPTALDVSSSSETVRRKSSRLESQQYYSARRRFVRFVETGALHACLLHGELFSLSTTPSTNLSWRKLRNSVFTYSPIWLDAKAGVHASTLLLDCVRFTRTPVLPLVRELAIVHRCDVHVANAEGHTVVSTAAARGLEDVLEFLLESVCSCARRCRGKTSCFFMTSQRKLVRGEHTPLEWTRVLRDAERAHLATHESPIAVNTIKGRIKALSRCEAVLLRYGETSAAAGSARDVVDGGAPAVYTVS